MAKAIGLIISLTLALGAALPAQAAPASLAGTQWQLVEIRTLDDVDPVTRPADPARYTVAFGANGRAAVRLDCNRGQGSWTAGAPELPGTADGSLRFGGIATTRMFCPQPSLGTAFGEGLRAVRSYQVRDGKLLLAMEGDAGTMMFAPAP